jgi:hypothetical protein
MLEKRIGDESFVEEERACGGVRFGLGETWGREF